MPELAKSHPSPVRALTGLHRKLGEREPLSPINLDDPYGKVILRPTTPDQIPGDVDLMQMSFDISQFRDPFQGRHDFLDFTANFRIVGGLIQLLPLPQKWSRIEPTV
jgi:hypothetical protein